MENKETLEEAAEKYAEPFDNRFWVSATFKEGAEWQAERMYSEEDMKSAFFSGGDMRDIEEFNYWFKQYKKK